MFCPNCGTQNQENAQTCTKCGFSMKSAAPKFKGTMLMMNQNAAGLVKPGASAAPAAAPPAAGGHQPTTAFGVPPMAQGAAPSPAEPVGGHQPTAAFGAPPSVGMGAPSAGAQPPVPSRLKGTIVGVAAPAAGAAPAPPPAFDAAPTYGAPHGDPAQGYGAPEPAYGAPAAGGYGTPLHSPAGGGPEHQFGGGANPLGATVAFDGQGNQPPPGGFDANASGGFGRASGDNQGAYGAPPIPQNNPYGSPPMGGGDAFGAPPGEPMGGMHQNNPYGGPPMGGMQQNNPYGGAPMGGDYGQQPPPMGDYGAQQQQPMGGDYGQQQQYGQPMGQQQGMPPMGGMGGPMQPYGVQPMEPYGQAGFANPGALMTQGGQRPWLVTLLLAFFGGYLGIHRFYTGYTLFGVIQLLTCGGFGFWTLYDIIMIAMGKYVDAQGRPLLKE